MKKELLDYHLGWTPVRRGDVYCSPLCGGGCTHAEFTRCEMLAFRLVQQLVKGWRPRVWENLGWHWEVVRGEIHMRQDCDLRYTATCRKLGIDFTYATTPVEALQGLEARIRVAWREMNTITDQVTKSMCQAIDREMSMEKQTD